MWDNGDDARKEREGASTRKSDPKAAIHASLAHPSAGWLRSSSVSFWKGDGGRER